jgi:VWFA-related protein
MMFFIALVPILLPAQTDTFRTGVTLVKVDVAVTNPSGKAITDLKQDDFEITDEGAAQKILYLDHESEPLDLLLLLDVSGSMHPSLTALAAAARTALRPLRTGDRVAVMLFARGSTLGQPFTADFDRVGEQIAGSVKSTDLGSGTAINAAVLAAARYIGQQPATSRHAILIVTDNLSLNYRVPDEEVIRGLYGADASLNAILIGKQRRPDPPRPGQYVNPDFTPSDIYKLADETGGLAIEAKQAGESFALMIESIRSRYRLQYAAPPSPPGMFRRIQVQLAAAARKKNERAKLRARAGYYAIQ